MTQALKGKNLDNKYHGQGIVPPPVMMVIRGTPLPGKTVKLSRYQRKVQERMLSEKADGNS